jgi:hypothetical protein
MSNNIVLNTVDTNTGSTYDIAYGSLSNNCTWKTDNYTDAVQAIDSSYYQYKTYARIDFTDIVDVLTEAELRNVIDLYKSRVNKDTFSSFIRTVVAGNHFSEDFLLEYLEDLDKGCIMNRHSRDINSGEYKTVALYLNPSYSEFGVTKIPEDRSCIANY